MSRRPLVVGNWKMNTGREAAAALAAAVSSHKTVGVDVAICPPFPWLIPVAERLRGTRVGLGAQDCWPAPNGAFTGAVSVAMLAEICAYVIVGHSERRRLFAETDELVTEKAAAVLQAGMTPIVCVGEDLAVREAGRAAEHVRRQVEAALGDVGSMDMGRCVVAYEPVWAIGTGVAAAPSDAQEMSVVVRATLDSMHHGAGESVRVLYGGSATAENAGAIMAQADVDGALVGGASLDATAFLAIVAAVGTDD